MAPCSVQNDGVLAVIQIFFLIIPGLCGVMASVYAARQLITADVHKEIRAAIDTPGSERIDPFTKRAVTPPSNSKASLVLEHFAKDEQALLKEANGPTRLRSRVMSRLGVSAAVIACLVALCAITADETVVTLACMLLAVLFVLVPWDAVRLHVAKGDDFEQACAANGQVELTTTTEPAADKPERA